MSTPSFTPDPGPYFSLESEVHSERTKKLLARCYGKQAPDNARLFASVHRLIEVLQMLQHLTAREVAANVNDAEAMYKLGLIHGALSAAGIKPGEIPQ